MQKFLEFFYHLIWKQSNYIVLHKFVLPEIHINLPETNSKL